MIEPISDTSKTTENILIEGYRKMAVSKKMRQVSLLTQAVQKMAQSRLRQQYPRMSRREEKLRLASLWLPKETMVASFNWDPDREGY